MYTRSNEGIEDKPFKSDEYMYYLAAIIFSESEFMQYHRKNQANESVKDRKEIPLYFISHIFT